MHYQEVHEGKRPHICEICGKSFKKKAHVKLHMACHEENKSFQCHSSTKKFTSEKRRKDHEFTHKNIRKFECSLCDAKFKRCHHLDTHMKTIHNQIK